MTPDDNRASALTAQSLNAILEKMNNARVGLIGDLCLDMYWVADMKLSELSRETPHYPLPIVEERYAPGGAGNVACNLAALKPAVLNVIGLTGTDWRGELLISAFQERGISGRFIVQDASVQTNTYIKPLRTGISNVCYEDPRIDFENRAPISDICENRVLAALEEACMDIDVLCVSDQMKYGIITPRVREAIMEIARSGKTVIVDSRDRAALYSGVIVKPNEVEASRAFGPVDVGSLSELSTLCASIAQRNGTLAVITLGDKGCVVSDGQNVTHVPACPVPPPIDFCGAGDTFLSGFAGALAAGAAPADAARTATLCSAVTIRKIGMTGTATREEVRQAFDRLK